MRSGLLVLTLVVTSTARLAADGDIETEFGILRLSSPAIVSLADHGGCQFSANLENFTGMRWSPFGLRLEGTIIYRGNPKSVTLKARLAAFDEGGVISVQGDDLSVSEDCALFLIPYSLDVTVVSVSGLPDTERVKIFERKRSEAALKLARERAAAEMRRKMLAAAPRLDANPFPTIMGADKKCLEETLEALNGEGLIARKRLDELVKYRCASWTPRGTPVRILETQGHSVKITILDGPQEGQNGWVPAQWIKFPRADAR